MAVNTLEQILATELGSEISIQNLRDITEHVIVNRDAISVLEGATGVDTGWGAALDSRVVHAETGSSSSAYVIAMPNAAGESLYSGMNPIIVTGINQANSSTATLDVGTTNGAIEIKRFKADGSIQSLTGAELSPNVPAWLFWSGTVWILLNPVQIGADHIVGESAPTSGDGTEGDLFLVLDTA